MAAGSRTLSAMTFLPTHPRRLLAAAAIATLVGVASFLSLSTAPASADYGRCAPGDFCLYWNANATPSGGIYHFSGNDSNLRNDRFEVNHTNTLVANNSASAWVNGYAAARDDVIVYRSTGWGGGDLPPARRQGHAAERTGGTTSSPTSGRPTASAAPPG